MVKIVDRITVEADDICRKISATNSRAVSVQEYMGVSILNIICDLLFGKRFDITDEEFKRMRKAMCLLMDGMSPSDPVVSFPWLKYFPASKNVMKVKEGTAIIDNVIRNELLRHQETYQPGNIRDLTDSLIELSQKDELSRITGFTTNHFELVILDILIAGSEPTLSTIRWFFLFMLHHPQYQDKIDKEITMKTEESVEISAASFKSFPFIQATIQETLRLSSVLPLMLPRRATTNSSIAGRNIAKDSHVIFNSYAMHRDERCWEQPNNFYPERWLKSDGSVLPEKETSFLPFSTGQRSCVGEKMARAEMFVLIHKVMSQFEILPDPDSPLPDLEGKVTITYMPKEYKVIFKPR